MGTDAEDGGSLDEPSAGIDAYVPRVFATWLREDPATRWKQVDATLVFVDVSGFTALSERLARAGNIGAEELTDTISTCFAALLGVAYAGGGSLLKFGGDALLLLFAGDDHVERGARSAVGMRTALRELGKIRTSAGSVTLRMSIGVHSGDLHAFVVGGSHREFMITGPAATQTVTMEGAAEAGQIIVSPATAARLDPGVIGEPCGPGFLLAAAPTIDDPGYPLVSKGDDALLLQAIPVALREHLSSSLRDAEHRRVTIAFLKFKGLDGRIRDDGPAATADALDTMVRIAQEGADRHGITFLGTDVDAGGGKVLLIAGAPVSGGNDEERMLLALRDIVEQPSPIPFQIGVHAGHVFAGDIGPPYRRSYTVMGDAVNLAARVMSRSNAGEILATDEVLDAANTTFEVAQLEPFMVKGKSEPVIASTVGPVVGARAKTGAHELPFVGRQAELAICDDVLARAAAGSGRLLEVVGDAGIGKSRLIAEFRARAAGHAIHQLVCELHRASVPYGSTRKLLRTVLGIPTDMASEEVAEQVLAVLRRDLPHLLDWAPLLAIAFGTQLPATPATENLDEQFLRPRLNEVVIDFLRWAWAGPTLVTVEDAQWMDEASADVLRAVFEQLDRQPWVLCLSRREQDAMAPEGAPVTTMLLEPLNATDTATLAMAATQAAPLPTHEMDQLVERSGGNPLFLQELVTAARDVGGVESLPGSIESLVTARIDRLPSDRRSVLREISVLGYSFPRDLAAAVLTSGDVADLAGLRDFLIDEGDLVRFQHALVRDAAYSGMRYRLRRDLHAKAGDVIAASAGEEPTGQAPLLSFHFFHARRHEEAWRYSLAAADAARSVYANAEAGAFLERALESARGISALTPAEIAAVHERLGDVRDHMGSYPDAAAAYRAARRLLPADPVAEGRLMLKQAQQHGWLSKYSQALRWIRRALKRIEDVGGPEAADQRARLAVWYAQFCEEEGRHRLALRWCDRAITEAEATDARDVLAHAYRILDRAYANLGRFEEATHSANALVIYEELGDLRGQAAVTNNMAGLAYHLGDWATARDQLQRSLEVCERIGDQDGVAAATYNLGHLLCDQGRLSEAEELLGASLRLGQAAGHRASVAMAQRDLARVAARSGRHAKAMELLEAAHEAFQDVGAEVDDIDTLAVLAECHLLQGQPTQALAMVEDAVARSQSLGGISAQAPLLNRIRGYALLRSGAVTDAREAFDESLAAGRARDMDYEVALTLRGLIESASQEGSGVEPSEVDDWHAESIRVLERLEVVQVPDVPPSSSARESRSPSLQ